MNFEDRGHAHQFRQGACSHLRYNPSAVCLDSPLSGSKRRAGLLIEQSGCDECEYFSLARSQRVVAPQKLVAFGVFGTLSLLRSALN